MWRAQDKNYVKYIRKIIHRHRLSFSAVIICLHKINLLNLYIFNLVVSWKTWGICALTESELDSLVSMAQFFWHHKEQTVVWVFTAASVHNHPAPSPSPPQSRFLTAYTLLPPESSGDTGPSHLATSESPTLCSPAPALSFISGSLSLKSDKTFPPKFEIQTWLESST